MAGLFDNAFDPYSPGILGLLGTAPSRDVASSDSLPPWLANVYANLQQGGMPGQPAPQFPQGMSFNDRFGPANTAMQPGGAFDRPMDPIMENPGLQNVTPQAMAAWRAGADSSQVPGADGLVGKVMPGGRTEAFQGGPVGVGGPAQGTAMLGQPMLGRPPQGAPTGLGQSPPPSPQGIPQGASPGPLDRLQAAGAGFFNAGSPAQAIGNIIGGLITGQRQDDKGIAQAQQGLAQTALAQALIEKGVPPNQAVAAVLNPEFGKEIIKRTFPELKFEKVEQLYGAYNPYTGRFNVQGSAPKLEKLGPGDTLHSVTSALPGEAGGSTQVAAGGPEKAPEGYDWIDKSNPAKGLKPIAGGPATKLPANEAGYLAMMQASKQPLEAARKYFLDPKFKSGPVDAAGKAIGQATSSFEIGQHQRSVGIAVEAALRIATGAAAPDSEVKRYANFYMPSVYDSESTRKQKLDALNKFIQYAEKNIGAGRVPAPESFLGKSDNDPLGLR